MTEIAVIRGRATNGASITDADGFALITLDATTSENHSESMSVTDHPIEEGGVVTDHLQPDPIELTITGVISNTPLFTGDASLDIDRDFRAWEELRRIKDDKEIVSVVTPRRTYDNMVIKSISDTAGEGAPAWIEPTIVFRQILIASAEMVKIPREQRATVVRNSAQPQAEAGRQQAQAAEPAEQARATSVLVDLFG
jgi:hypothetical protein